MNRKTLEKLAKNPNYRLSEEELAQLEKYREEDFQAQNVKHSTKFNVHSPKIENERPQDGETSRG